LETFEESEKVVLSQVQLLDCYQIERRQGESWTEKHSHSRRWRICLITTTVVLKRQSQHFILTTSHSPDL